MLGQLRIIQGGYFKIREDWEKFKYEGAYKISWGFEKIEGARLSGPVTEACIEISVTNDSPESVLDKHFRFEVF